MDYNEIECNINWTIFRGCNATCNLMIKIDEKSYAMCYTQMFYQLEFLNVKISLRKEQAMSWHIFSSEQNVSKFLLFSKNLNIFFCDNPFSLHLFKLLLVWKRIRFQKHSSMHVTFFVLRCICVMSFGFGVSFKLCNKNVDR